MAILFIPGIKGSELHDSQAPGTPSYWPRAGALPGDLVHQPRRLALGADRHIRAGRVLPHIATPLLDQLQHALPGEKIIPWGYDWRQPLELSAQALLRDLQKLQEQAAKHGRTEKFSLVTHSMGGLVVRSALTQAHPLWEQLARIVFIAPPFRGSLGSVYSLVAGETDSWFGIGPEQRKIARTFPSVYQLLPSWPAAAHDEAQRPVDLFDAHSWQANVRQSSSFNAQALRNAEAFVRGPGACHGGHSDLPMTPLDAGSSLAERCLVIAGTGIATPTALPVLRANAPNPNWFDFAHLQLSDHGDGRVLVRSAAIAGVGLAIFSAIQSHATLCRDERVIATTQNWLQHGLALRAQPRTAADPVRRERDAFPRWDGSSHSFASHTS